MRCLLVAMVFPSYVPRESESLVRSRSKRGAEAETGRPERDKQRE
jgi:hypothetical protein